jgi:hypothetical protein
MIAFLHIEASSPWLIIPAQKRPSSSDQFRLDPLRQIF